MTIWATPKKQTALLGLMIRIIENQARNDQIQMLTAETQMAKALWEIRGVARIFPEVRTFFQISLSYPLSPNSEFDQQKHSHRHN